MINLYTERADAVIPIKIIFVTFLISIFSHVAIAESSLDIINQYRQSVGLSHFKYASSLAQAAKNHATYLSKLDPKQIKTVDDAHGERSGHVGFTGKTLADRVKHVAYPHQRVSENISMGNKDNKNSISLLMSGIYHRFGFLDFAMDEMGYGIVDKIYVYNMGRNDLTKTCQNPPDEALAKTPKDCLGTTVKQEFWDNLCSSITKADQFEPPFKQRCSNKTLLNKHYMEGICRNPPQEALLQGNGEYYKICGGNIKISAKWLDTLCENPTPEAKYRGNGHYYEICDNKYKVPAYWLEDVCSAVPEFAKYTDSGKYYSSCNFAKYKIRKEYMQQLDDKRYASNPKYIKWPAPNAKQVDIAFYSEIPDPLPDLKSSGYPFSLQFNQGKVKKVQIIQAKLDYLENGSWQPVTKIRELNNRTDPHKELSKLEFAWFPLDKLKWGTKYRATIKAKLNGKLEKIQWQFRTKDFLGFLSS